MAPFHPPLHTKTWAVELDIPNDACIYKMFLNYKDVRVAYAKVVVKMHSVKWMVKLGTDTGESRWSKWIAEGTASSSETAKEEAEQALSDIFKGLSSFTENKKEEEENNMHACQKKVITKARNDENRELAAKLVERLNAMLASSPDMPAFFGKLINQKVAVTNSIVDTHNVFCTIDNNNCQCAGFLGVLNGLIGPIGEGAYTGMGYIAALTNKDGGVERFELSNDKALTRIFR